MKIHERKKNKASEKLKNNFFFMYHAAENKHKRLKKK